MTLWRASTSVAHHGLSSFSRVQEVKVMFCQMKGNWHGLASSVVQSIQGTGAAVVVGSGVAVVAGGAVVAGAGAVVAGAGAGAVVAVAALLHLTTHPLAPGPLFLLSLVNSRTMLEEDWKTNFFFFPQTVSVPSAFVIINLPWLL